MMSNTSDRNDETLPLSDDGDFNQWLNFDAAEQPLQVQLTMAAGSGESLPTSAFNRRIVSISNDTLPGSSVDQNSSSAVLSVLSHSSTDVAATPSSSHTSGSISSRATEQSLDSSSSTSASRPSCSVLPSLQTSSHSAARRRRDPAAFLERLRSVRTRRHRDREALQHSQSTPHYSPPGFQAHRLGFAGGSGAGTGLPRPDYELDITQRLRGMQQVRQANNPLRLPQPARVLLSPYDRRLDAPLSFFPVMGGVSLRGEPSNMNQSKMCSKRAPNTAGSVCYTKSSLSPTLGILHYSRAREMSGGIANAKYSPLLQEYRAEIVPTALERTEYDLGTMDKVFASAWLNNSQIVFGTKSNELMVLNYETRQMARIPSLESTVVYEPSSPGGIHALDISPASTYLATGASNVNDIAVYRLPTLDPVCVCEGAHDDWLFDLKWLDDYCFVSGSRDCRLAVWKVPDDYCSDSRSGVDLGSASRLGKSRLTTGGGSGWVDTTSSDGEAPVIASSRGKWYKRQAPLHVSHDDDPNYGGIRSLAYNSRQKEIAILTSQAFLRLVDVETFQVRQCQLLPCRVESVCLDINSGCNFYAAGSKSHVTLVDANTCKTIHSFKVLGPPPMGARSLAFNEHILSVGTGSGMLAFYDVRAQKYLMCGCQQMQVLYCGHGYFRQDQYFHDMDEDLRRHAIYTHCYDATKTKLFTAGGPLPANIWGNYAAVWKC